MATFIRWKETGAGTTDRFLVSMYSTLSSRYYPVNVIGSGLYDIFSMYADEIAELYTEIQQSYDDLSIDTVRATPITDRSYSKMYDNFGALIKAPKRFDQYYENYSTASMVQSYRQQLRFLMQSYLNGMSITGLEKLGQAFTGVSPLIEQHIKANPRWILSAYNGSVLSVGDGFIIANTFIPRIGNVIPIDNSERFSVGDNFSVSFTHLGYNTKLSGEDLYYNTVVATYYTNTANPTPQYLTTLQDNVDYHTLRVIRADQQVRSSWERSYTYYRPDLAYDSGSIMGLPVVPISGLNSPAWVYSTVRPLTSDFTVHENGFLYNTGRLHASGSVHITPALDLGNRYNKLRWYYDWMVNTREYGDYTIEVRQYPSASIPSGVYYIPIVSLDQAIPPILTEDTGSIRAHWFNVRSQSVYDAHGISSLVATSVPTYKTILARDPRRYCFLYDSSITFKQTANTYLNFTESMSAEMWLRRLYSGSKTANNLFEIKREQGSSYYKFYINSNDKTLHLSISDGATTGDASVSIAPYMNLEAPYPHYFAVSYISGSVLFFANGATLGTSSIATPEKIPDMTNATQSIFMEQGIGVDEILLSSTYVDDVAAYDNFMNTRPRYTGVGIPSASVERYQQAKFTFYGYNVRDIELHQFSIRGVLSQSITKYLNPYYNYPYIMPIFKKL